MKIVNLARILLNERIFLSYSWLAGKSGKVEWGGGEAAVSAVKVTQNKSEKANSHSPSEKKKENENEKKRKGRQGKCREGK